MQILIIIIIAAFQNILDQFYPDMYPQSLTRSCVLLLCTSGTCMQNQRLLRNREIQAMQTVLQGVKSYFLPLIVIKVYVLPAIISVCIQEL